MRLEDIAVLTPYSAQRNEIVKMLPGKYSDLKVASITESQGQKVQYATLGRLIIVLSLTGDEYELVILSTVRSKPLDEISNRALVQPDRMWMGENLGFITDVHQINVGITRSKSGLVITGEWNKFHTCLINATALYRQ